MSIKKLLGLANGDWFRLPGRGQKGYKIYGNECRVRVCLGSEDVVINGKTVFTRVKEADWAPTTDVEPIKKPTGKRWGIKNGGNETMMDTHSQHTEQTPSQPKKKTSRKKVKAKKVKTRKGK